MRLQEFAEWRDLLASYPFEALWRMAQQLGLDRRVAPRKETVLVALAGALQDGRPVRERLPRLDATERLALRLALDGGEDGLPGSALASELHAAGARTGRDVVRGLLERGLLLVNTELRPSWGGVADALQGDGFTRWRLIAHPVARAALAAVAVAGETQGWDRLARPVPRAQVVHAAPAGSVVHALRATCDVIDAQPQPFTQAGVLRAVVEKRLERVGYPSSGTFDFSAWLAIALALGLATQDEAASRWRRASRARALVTDPLSVLGRTADLFNALDPALVAFQDAPWATAPQSLRFGLGYGHSFGGLGPDMSLNVLALLTSAVERFLPPGVWFRDDEVAPALQADARRFLALMKGGDAHFWAWRSIEPADMRAAAARFVSHFLDVLAVLAWVDRGAAPDGARLARLTWLGYWQLSWLATDPDLPAPPAPPHGPLRWTKDGRLVPAEPSDAPVVELALGSLGRRDPGGPGAGFRVDAAALGDTLAAGEPADVIEHRLRAFVPGAALPEPVARALRELAGARRPAVLYDEVVAVQLPGDAPADLAALRAAGYKVVEAPTPLVLVPTGSVGPFLRRIGVGVAAGIDYDARPSDVCRLGDDLSLVIPRTKRSDLRLERVLEELGVPTPAPDKVRLSFAAIPGTADLPEAALAAHLAGLLRRLEPHLDGPVPDAARFQLLVDAGVVDAPAADRALVLTFPDEVARGLTARQTLAPEAEPLPGGRFLVPAVAIAAVEGKLSALGIPFPAEHSSLRERARARAAVGRLQEAVADLDRTAPEPERPVPVPVPDTAREPRRPTGGPPGRTPAAPDTTDEARVLAAVAAAGRNGTGGLRLGEVAAAVDLDKREAKTILRRLVDAGRVELTGHARGAYYRPIPIPSDP